MTDDASSELILYKTIAGDLFVKTEISGTVLFWDVLEVTWMEVTCESTPIWQLKGGAWKNNGVLHKI